MRSLRLLAPLLVLSACGPTQQPPEATCTDGCFASSGSCIKAADQIDTLCGLSGGGSCQNCVIQGLVCQKGFGCTRGPNLGGGSAGGGIAGGSAAGGSAAGGAAAGGSAAGGSAAGGAAAGGAAAGGAAAGGAAAGGAAAGGAAAGGAAAGGAAAGGAAAGGSAAGGSAAGGSAGGGSAGGGSAAGGSAGGGSATCVNLCSGSVSICDSAGVRTCQVDASGCSVFGAPQTCPSMQSCSGGSCQSTCTNQCSLNATQCASSGAPVRCQTLSNGCTDWVLQTTCSPGQVCSGGTCVTSSTCINQCSVGATRCTTGGQQQTCVTLASGCTDWSLPIACSGGQTCASPRTTCAVPQCTAGQRRCTTAGAPGVETCDAQGSWYVTSQCPQACSAGSCTASAACSAGTVRCNGTNIEICNASGTAWLYNQTCAVACTSGICTGPCTPSQKRCNVNVPETCNPAGSAWVAAQSCAYECYRGECTQNDLVIDGTTQTLEGDLKFSNNVTIRNQGQLRVGPTGILKIRARNITVESNTTINANDLGVDTRGQGGTSVASCLCNSVSLSTGSSYGTSGVNGTGTSSYCGYPHYSSCTPTVSAPGTYDRDDDLSISQGSRWNGATNKGGGLVQLIADTVTINGQITANSTSNGASGGGVLVAANQISGSGVIQTSGATSPAGGNGRVKLLRGTTNNFFSGNITGNNRASPMPPLDLVSGSHPDQARWYNDGLGDWFLAWSRPYQSLTGYYWKLSTSASTLPSAAAMNGTFLQAESIQVPASQLTQGMNYVHIVSVDSAFNVGTVKATATVQVSTQPPTITSTSHPTQRTWGGTAGLFFSWTNPQADSNFNGYYFTLDRYADTVPAATPTNFTSNKQVLLANTPDGIWGFHVVNRDTRGAITKAAAHYIVYVGANPGVGNISGSAYDGSMGNAALSGVTLTINRGFFSQTTASNGTYTFSNMLPAGTWEVTASKTGYVSQTVTVTVAAAGSVNQNFTLLRAP